MQKRWLVKAPIENTIVEDLRSKLKVDPIVAELLLQRGVTEFEEAETFFRPSLEKLHDPFLMKDMDKAIARIEFGIGNKEPILIFGITTSFSELAGK